MWTVLLALTVADDCDPILDGTSNDLYVEHEMKLFTHERETCFGMLPRSQNCLFAVFVWSHPRCIDVNCSTLRQRPAGGLFPVTQQSYQTTHRTPGCESAITHRPLVLPKPYYSGFRSSVEQSYHIWRGTITADCQSVKSLQHGCTSKAYNKRDREVDVRAVSLSESKEDQN